MCGLNQRPPMTEPSDSTRKRRAGPEDLEIGRKIRALRLERGLSQSGLADGIDLTFQQVQKYEKGANRVSAGRLQRNSSLAFLQSKGAMRLLRAYAGIGSRTTKYALVTLAESLRKNDERANETTARRYCSARRASARSPGL